MQINMNDFVHIPELSEYNNNYYKGKKDNSGVMLFEHCDEYFSIHTFYLVQGDSKILLGSAQNFKCDKIMEISFGEIYT